MNNLKKILAVLALGMFVSGGIIGCEASAKVGDEPANTSDSTYVKKTTTVQHDNGDRTTRTEIQHTD